MLTRRDKLLIRPWQQRRYENHRRKVQSALPAIDNRPPVSRDHVAVKLKKKQKETERITKIEKENLILLRKMSYIMRTSRVDNNWMTPLPNFLNRVAIYSGPKNEDVYIDVEIPPVKRDHIRKTRCTACTPEKIPKVLIPEERVPWEPEKAPISRRAKSVPSKSVLPTIIEKESETKSLPTKQRSAESSKRAKKQDNEFKSDFTVFEDCMKSAQSIIFSRGSLHFSVNFPSDTTVKLQEGRSERLIVGNECFCKGFSRASVSLDVTES